MVVSVAFCLMSRRSGDQGCAGCQQDCALQTEGTDFNKSQRLLTTNGSWFGRTTVLESSVLKSDEL